MKITVEGGSLAEIIAACAADMRSQNAPSELISSLGLSVRAENCLKAENIYTLGELAAYPRPWIKIPNMGQNTVSEISVAVLRWAFAKVASTAKETV